MNCYRCSRSIRLQKQAFTLLEVIVGLTLMATVLVGSLLAFSAHRKQRRYADAKLVAVAVADDLLDQLSGSPQGIPPAARGPIAGRPDWFWRTTVLGATTPAQISMQVIRFQIIEQTPQQSLRALVTIDLVKPLEAG